MVVFLLCICSISGHSLFTTAILNSGLCLVKTRSIFFTLITNYRHHNSPLKKSESISLMFEILLHLPLMGIPHNPIHWWTVKGPLFSACVATVLQSILVLFVNMHPTHMECTLAAISTTINIFVLLPVEVESVWVMERGMSGSASLLKTASLHLKLW